MIPFLILFAILIIFGITLDYYYEWDLIEKIIAILKKYTKACVAIIILMAIFSYMFFSKETETLKKLKNITHLKKKPKKMIKSKKIIKPKIIYLTPQEKKAGKKPENLIMGEVFAITKYLNNNLKNPGSLKVIKHTKVKFEELNGVAYWYQRVKYRAKNSFGGYVIEDKVFKIRYDRVFDVIDTVTFVTNR